VALLISVMMCHMATTHPKDIYRAIANKKPKFGNVAFIAVDGHGGSGKSHVANYLAHKLHAEIIHTDDFASWDNPLNWWPLVIERVFRPIAGGATTLSYPRSKWWPDHQPEPMIDQPVTSIMILEGVSSLRKEFRTYLSFGIFVDTPEEIGLERGIKRDASSGKPREEIVKLWQQWLHEENIYLQRDQPKRYADLIIDGTKPLEQQII
jgi:uridine kinase